MAAQHRHHRGLQRLLVIDKVGFGHDRFQPGGIEAFGRDRIPQGQHHCMDVGMEFPGLAHQVETAAALEIVGADQQLVGIPSFHSQIIEAALLIGDRTGDAGGAPEAAAKGPEHEAPPGHHRNPARNLNRLQPFFLGPMAAIGQKLAEIHSPAVDLAAVGLAAAGPGKDCEGSQANSRSCES